MVWPVTLLLTWVDLWFFRCPAIHWSGFMSSQIFHWHSLCWFHVIPGVSLLLIGVIPRGPRCHRATQLSGSVSFQVSFYLSLQWLFIISAVPLLLTELPLCHSRYFATTHLGGCILSQMPTTAHKGDSSLSQVYHYCSFGGSLSFQVSYCHSLSWLCIISAVSLPLTGVTLWSPKCPTVAYRGGSALSQVEHFHSFGWLYVILDVLLPLIGAQGHPSCPTAFTDMALTHLWWFTDAYWGVSMSPQVS